MISLVFKYWRKNSASWDILNISHEEYFDLDEDENCEIDSIPLYPHFHQYLDIPVQDIHFIYVSITDNNNRRIFKQTFWNNGENFCTERTDEGDTPYREVIITSLIDIETKKYEIIRLILNAEFIFPSYHGFITNNADGSQSEQKLDLELFKKLYQAVGDLQSPTKEYKDL